MIKICRYNAGEVILKENDDGEAAYIIEKGRVEVTRDLDGRRIHLAYLGEGDPFGEMSMIDEKPRSATVTAVEDTVLREVHRDDFFRSLQHEPDVAVSLLRALFERLRETTTSLILLQQMASKLAPPEGPEETPVAPEPTTEAGVFLSGLTPQASKQLGEDLRPINKFPFRIGRKSDDPLVHNDLALTDFMPFQISRHHLALIRKGGRFGLIDRGSSLGALVDGRQIGGRKGAPGPHFFEHEETTIVLGTRKSAFQFKVTLSGIEGLEKKKKPSIWDMF